jgi:CDP-diacylglycerol---serine O-phosphatidyltransferase
MRHLPNLMTLANLFCGCLAIVSIFGGELTTASIFIFIAALLDFGDGFVARKLNAFSELGKQLDSLADMVSFGVVPGLMLYALFVMGSTRYDFDPTFMMTGQYFMFSVTLFSCLRLALFNIDTRQSTYFIGVPTPANTMMIMSLPFILEGNVFGFEDYIYHPFFLILFAGISSYLLVAEIPLLALKFKSFAWNVNKGPYLLLIVSALSILLLKFAAAPIILIFYVILSLIFPPNKKTT